ncbi:MAG: hypothetical protein WBA90_10975, partial [Albidovulum sp.]
MIVLIVSIPSSVALAHRKDRKLWRYAARDDQNAQDRRKRAAFFILAIVFRKNCSAELSNCPHSPCNNGQADITKANQSDCHKDRRDASK